MPDKPLNLLIITPDQMRADYLSCYGHPFIDAQHTNRLADKGVCFERAYCAAPLCGPSRISFATSTRVGEHGHRNYGSTLNYGVPNIVSELKERGYRTGMFGKNHLFNYEQLPLAWDELDEICLGNYDRHPKYEHSWSSFEMEPDHEYNITYRLTSEIIDFMGRQASGEQPFLAWVNYQDPHPAYTCPAPYSTMFSPDQCELPPNFKIGFNPDKPRRNYNWQTHSEMPLATELDMRKAMAMYCGQVRYVDDQVGRMLDALNDVGIADTTLVMFMGDHGELLGDHGITHKHPAFYECLTRIPVMMYHPQGRWQRTRFSGLVEEVDLAPTLLNGLGFDPPPTMVGESLDGRLQEGRDEGRADILVEAGAGAPQPKEPLDVKHKAPFAPNSFGPGAMISNGRYKLSFYVDDVPELYDIEVDPWEMHNLWNVPECAEVRRELTERLLERVLGVRMRYDLPVEWPGPGTDPRFEPLEYRRDAGVPDGEL